MEQTGLLQQEPYKPEASLKTHSPTSALQKACCGCTGAQLHASARCSARHSSSGTSAQKMPLTENGMLWSHFCPEPPVLLLFWTSYCRVTSAPYVLVTTPRHSRCARDRCGVCVSVVSAAAQRQLSSFGTKSAFYVDQLLPLSAHTSRGRTLTLHRNIWGRSRDSSITQSGRMSVMIQLNTLQSM